MNRMDNDKSHALTGKNNKRLDVKMTRDNQSTAAWAQADHRERETNVIIPTDSGIANAKEWVDNGSKL